MYCEITYQMTGERWGIFPRDIGEFQARISNSDRINSGDNSDTIIMKSASIELMSCSFDPDKKNKRHREALDGLIVRLEKAGWTQLPERGVDWYNIRFHKITPA
ncbi:MAG: hypothetical protein K0R55_343 [Sporomusa sp.]|jgi:hypothetical protein|nr:hypothetical protein [Sporomusa sp.]